MHTIISKNLGAYVVVTCVISNSVNTKAQNEMDKESKQSTSY